MYEQDTLIDTIRELEQELAKVKDEFDDLERTYDYEYVHQDDVRDHAYDMGLIDPEYMDPSDYGFIDEETYHDLRHAVEEVLSAIESLKSDGCFCEDCFVGVVQPALDSLERYI